MTNKLIVDYICNNFLLFQQSPTNNNNIIDFEITILNATDPDIQTVEDYINNNNNKESSSNDNNNDNNNDDDDATTKNNKDKSLLTKLLKTYMIVQEGHFGLDARILPFLTRQLKVHYKQLKQQDQQTTTTKTTIFELYQTTSCLLLLLPDHATYWHDRRNCLLSLIIQKHHPSSSSSLTNDNDNNDNNKKDVMTWEQELSFLNLLMTQHSKAPFSWGHRKYVIQQLLQQQQEKYNHSNDTTTARSILNFYESLLSNEFQTCTKIADKYPKNYYAWTHRIYMLQHVLVPLQKIESQESSSSITIGIIQKEWDFCINWLSTHVSDHSAVHYGTQLIHFYYKLLKYQEINNNENKKMVMKHHDAMIQQQQQQQHDDDDTQTLWEESVLQNVRNLLQKYPKQETLWIFRRDLICQYIKYDIQYENMLINDNENSKSMISTIWNLDIEQVYNTWLEQQQEQQQQQGQHYDSEKYSHVESYLAWVCYHVVNATNLKDKNTIQQQQQIKLVHSILQSIQTKYFIETQQEHSERFVPSFIRICHCSTSNELMK